MSRDRESVVHVAVMLLSTGVHQRMYTLVPRTRRSHQNVPRVLANFRIGTPVIYRIPAFQLKFYRSRQMALHPSPVSCAGVGVRGMIGFFRSSRTAGRATQMLSIRARLVVLALLAVVPLLIDRV